MLHYARFALLAGLAAGIPAAIALDPPQHPNQPQTTGSENKTTDSNNKKKAEPAKPSSKDGAAERIDRRKFRMRERDREIDRRLNQQKKK